MGYDDELLRWKGFTIWLQLLCSLSGKHCQF